MRKITHLLSVLSLTLLPGLAKATTEIPGPFDARSIALGGAAVAVADNASAIFHNPAGLDQIKRGTITAGVFPFRSQNTVPLEGPSTAKESSGGFFPLFFAGGAYRFSDRVVAGIATYPVAGSGGAYDNVALVGGEDLDFGIVLLETNIPISIRLTEQLSVALGWRVTYMNIQASNVDPNAGVVTQNLKGADFAAAELGVHFRPSDVLRLGFTYRTKMSISASGNTKMGGQNIDTTTTFAQPHAFRLGTAVALLQKRLNLALDLKYLMFSESNKKISTTMQTPAGPLVSNNTLNWKDAVSVHAGAEYFVAQGVPIRLGYSATTSAVPKESANPFATVPAVIQSISGGAGKQFENWDIDAGLYYSFGESRATPTAGFPGNYRSRSLMLGISGSWKL